MPPTRSIVKTTKLVRIADLEPHPDNAKTHDIPALRESLRTTGQYTSIVCQIRPAGLRILAGHGLVEAAIAEGWTQLRADLVDVDDDTARRIVLVDNRSQDLGGYDVPRLLDLIGRGSTPADLVGTGYTIDDVTRLMATEKPPRFDPTDPSLPMDETRSTVTCPHCGERFTPPT